MSQNTATTVRTTAGRRPSADGLPQRARLTRWGDAIFPEPAPRMLHGWARWTLLACLLVAGVPLSLFRLPVETWNVLWAEDGAVFLQDALSGDPGVIFHPYAGYMHLVPRLAIALAALFPLSIVPLVVTILAATITSLTALACFLFLETRIRTAPLRLAAWAVLLVVPVAGGEVAVNLANLHWFLMTAAVCALIVRSRGTAFTVVQCIVVVAAVGSDPLTLIFLPLVAIRWLVLRGGIQRTVVYAFLAAAVLQLSVTFVGIFVTEGRSFGRVIPPVPDLADFYTFRVVISGLVGFTATTRYADALGATIPGVVVSAVFAVIIAVAVRRPGPRYAILAAAGSSVAFFGIVFALQWNVLGPNGALGLAFGQRYSLLPTVLLLMALIVALDGVLSGRRLPTRILGGALVVLVIAVPAALDYRWVEYRGDSASWPDALETAGEECGPDVTAVEVKSSPAWFPGTMVACDLVEDAVP